MGIKDINELSKRFNTHDINTIYFKHLSPKQDNDKNQIYLGGGLDGITNLFPTEIFKRSPSISRKKRHSESGKPKLEARLDLEWMGKGNDLFPAPNTRIIDYFQYPEIRLSGFLRGCSSPPDSLRRRNQSKYGKRILALGITSERKVVGLVLTQFDDPIVSNFPDLPELPSARILKVFISHGEFNETPFDLLKKELTKIITDGWHKSVILKKDNNSPVPFKGNQGGGYTLEALLGVNANAQKGPDKYGYEIKSYGGQRISLMTPVPDLGYQGEHPFRTFMDKFGTAGVKGDGSIRFTGTHRCGHTNEKTGLRLIVNGYDCNSDGFDDGKEIAVLLINQLTEEIALGWSISHLANSWNKKHSAAIYIKSEKRSVESDDHDHEYRYQSNVLVGEGTDIWKLLRGIALGYVFYDPADSIYSNGTAKVRPQWRINSSKLADVMKHLYKEVREVTL
mgnify:FL=1